MKYSFEYRVSEKHVYIPYKGGPYPKGEIKSFSAPFYGTKTSFVGHRIHITHRVKKTNKQTKGQTGEDLPALQQAYS